LINLFFDLTLLKIKKNNEFNGKEKTGYYRRPTGILLETAVVF